GEPAEAEAGHRDAELRRGDVAIGRGHRPPYRARAAVPFGNQLIDPRLAHRHDRELRRDEQAVGAHQRREAGQPPQSGRKRVFHAGNLRASATGTTNTRTAGTTKTSKLRRSTKTIFLQKDFRVPSCLRRFVAPVTVLDAVLGDQSALSSLNAFAITITDAPVSAS